MQENSPAAQNSIDEELRQKLTIDHFDYDLPAELIAQEPVAVRHESRLMQVDRRSGLIAHRSFQQIVDILQPGDLLVLNNTKVIPARIVCRKVTGGAVELLLLKPEPTRPGVWQAMATPLRKLRAGEKLQVQIDSLAPVNQPEASLGNQGETLRENQTEALRQNQGETSLENQGETLRQNQGETLRQNHCEMTVLEFIEAADGSRRVLVDLGGQRESFQLLSRIGYAPLPPYIQRRIQEDTAGRRQADLDRYQTVFAQAPGAVAAPTAGLHFSEQVLAALKGKGVELAFLTLHVGPGTFKPITSSISDHTIEYERFDVSQDVARIVNDAKAGGRRVIAVGTTSCRALETAGASGKVIPTSDGLTDLYIKPGYQFRILDGLLTNFHLPRSSLLLLVAAFAGYELTRRCYETAVKERYRFYSYGDAMLIL